MNTELNFENWYNKVLESIQPMVAPAKVESTTVADTKTAQSHTASNVEGTIEASPSKTEIISDVDSIMNNLAKLSVQIKEAVDLLDLFENEEVTEVNEDEAIFELDTDSIKAAGSKIADWMYYAPKYRTMQKKINKMKMNALDIQLAYDLLPGDAENKAKKEALKSKKTNMDASIRDLQSEVDNKARERGEYISKVLNSEKIKGKMELVKRASGQEDNPNKKKELADSFKELNARYAEEQNAIKQLQNNAQEQEAEKKTKTSTKQEEEPKQNKSSELEAEIKQYNKNINDERVSLEKAKEELKNEKDADKIAKLKDLIQQHKEDISELKNRIKKAKEDFNNNASAQESLVYAALELGLNEMVADIQSKQDWQFENNSALYIRYKQEIDKQTASAKINESHSDSIADKFRTLLG